MPQKTETQPGRTPQPDPGALAPEERLIARGETESGPKGGPSPPAAPRRRRAFLIVVAVIVIGVAVFFMWRHYAQWESTDDAEIEGYIYQISARVSGHVIKVPVENTEYVDKGTVLAQLDPTDYQVAIDRAKAQLANAQATARVAQFGIPITSVNTLSQVHSAQADVQSAQAGITAAERQFDAARAKVTAAEANNVFAQQNERRYAELVGKKEVSQQQYDQSISAAQGTAANVVAVQASAAAA
ncbi:MAG: HlyD family secretion protein, partial [Terriglobia bacterium]